MLNVQEHIKGERILDPATQRPREMMRPVAVVMDSPDREERRHALSDQHGPYMVTQEVAMEHSEYQRDPDRAQQQFSPYGHAQFSVAVSKSG